MNIFELGIKAFKHMDDIKRVIQMIQPTINAYKAAPDLVPTLQKAIKLGAPIINEYAKVEPTLVPLISNIMNDFFPPLQAPVTRQLTTPAGGYNVTWLQQSLLDLKVVHHLVVDGDYGPSTKQAVEEYQKNKVIHQEPTWTNDDIDGWAGLKTCAAIYNDLAK